jgi:hypothetical protein
MSRLSRAYARRRPTRRQRKSGHSRSCRAGRDLSCPAYPPAKRISHENISTVSGVYEKLVRCLSLENHLRVFAGWRASDETHNLSGDAKAEWLVAQFGESGSD